MAETPRTILLQTNSRDMDARPIREKHVKTANTVTPGMLIAIDGGELVPHATAAGHAQKLFALEPAYTGGYGNSAKAIDTTWTPDNGPVRFIYAQTGDKVYAWLADEGNVVEGAPLVSDGAGALVGATIDATTIAGAVVAYAAESVNNVGGSGPVRIKVIVA